MGNKVAGIEVPKEENSNYSKWVFCPTCNNKLLAGVDTDYSYGFISRFARNIQPTEIPIEYCHISRVDELIHVKSVRLDETGNVVYEQDVHQV